MAGVAVEGGSFEELKRGHIRYLSEVAEGAMLDRDDVSEVVGELWVLGIRYFTMVNEAEDIADVPAGETERTGDGESTEVVKRRAEKAPTIRSFDFPLRTRAPFLIPSIPRF